MDDFGTLTYTPLGAKEPVRVNLPLGTSMIGRGADSVIRLNVPEVAEQHACITASQSGCRLINLSPQNRVMIRSTHAVTAGVPAEREQLRPDEARVLRHNDEIFIGRFTLRYERVVAMGVIALPPERAVRRWDDDLTHLRRQIQPEAIVLPPIQQNGHALTYNASSYMRYLPPIYQSDNGVNSFLLAFEAIFAPLERMIDEIDCYFHPWLTPAALLPWLASWVGIVLDTDWPLERQRAVLSGVARLYPWRGTRHGLTELIRLYTGCETTIVEPPLEPAQATELRLDIDTFAHLDADTFLVVVRPGATPIDEQALRALRRLIEAEKPAHTRYLLSTGVDEARGP